MKENTNIYFQARKEASKGDARLFNRDFAAEQLGVASYTLGEYERGVTKVVPIDKVVLMADLYNKPELVTNYCRHECPVHGFLPLATEDKGIQGITLRLLNGLDDDDLDEMKSKLIDIAEDGEVSDEEVAELRKIVDQLTKIAEVISELKIAAEKRLKGR
ncbi:MAG: XRE family transcriptional regulator [Eubacteriales bacterium]|nr:XRE family transcriptional regulator [Eubacteriales bacterium]